MAPTSSNRCAPSLKILFLCTAHNSLSQRLSLVLQECGHKVTIELAISSELMIEAAKLAAPDLIICSFLTKKVPAEVFESYLTWIVHPGAPGDAGPSSLDWVLLGDDGTEPDASKALEILSTNDYVASGKGRTHWGVTVLQAIEELDAGPVWAWDQFPIVLDGPEAFTKASLYRGPVTQAAVAACLCAIERLLSVVPIPSFPSIHPGLSPEPLWAHRSVTTQEEFHGGQTRSRPLLKPTQRAWDVKAHSAALVSRRLRASDSQPGVQSCVLYGRNLYLYGGTIETNRIPFDGLQSGEIAAQRNGAVLVMTADGKGVWITHVRRLKPKGQALLPAKLPAIVGLKSVPGLSEEVDLDAIPTWELVGFTKVPGTFQEVWIEYDDYYGAFKTAYVHFQFYNGAASTSQCRHLLAAIEEVTSDSTVAALVLMGGDYWNNGIHLGVCSTNLSSESWSNINAINDCVEAILKANIVTFAAIRGNAAAGGFALATCCDFVFAADNVVINPHYRAVGLYGSEYHTLTWYARAGEESAKTLTRGLLPLSAKGACELGLVDIVIRNGTSIVEDIKFSVTRILLTDADQPCKGAPWTKRSYFLQNPPEHRRVIDSVPLRKRAWLNRLPQALSCYRDQELDFMKLNFTDSRYESCVQNFTGKAAPINTPLRFALHRRYTQWEKVLKDAEEQENYFDYPDVDSQIVYSLLGICSSKPINLCSPPSFRDRLTFSASPELVQTHGPLRDFGSPPSSGATTLINSVESSRENSRSPGVITKMSKHEISPGQETVRDLSPTRVSYLNDFDPPGSRRLSRVVQKLKAAFVVKPDQAFSSDIDKAVSSSSRIGEEKLNHGQQSINVRPGDKKCSRRPSLNIRSTCDKPVPRPTTAVFSADTLRAVSSKPCQSHQMPCYYNTRQSPCEVSFPAP